jgi:hypothetical protein
MQRERRAWVYRRAFPTRFDKAVRAQSIRGRMAIDGLYVPQNAAWYPDFGSDAAASSCLITVFMLGPICSFRA